MWILWVWVAGSKGVTIQSLLSLIVRGIIAWHIAYAGVRYPAKENHGWNQGTTKKRWNWMPSMYHIGNSGMPWWKGRDK